jgi:hypothetical protein
MPSYESVVSVLRTAASSLVVQRSELRSRSLYGGSPLDFSFELTMAGGK